MLETKYSYRILLVFLTVCLILFTRTTFGWNKFIKNYIDRIRVSLSNGEKRSGMTNEATSLKKGFLLLGEVIERAKIDNTVLVTTTNFGYLDLFENFMASIRKVATDRLKMVIAVAEDPRSYEYLRGHYPQNLFPLKHFDNNTDMEGILNFRTLLYKKLVSRRPTYLYEIMKHNVTILYMDSDSVWVQNPFDILNKKQNRELLMIPDAYPPHVYNQFGILDPWRSLRCWGYCCTCFLFLKPTEKGSSQYYSQRAQSL